MDEVTRRRIVVTCQAAFRAAWTAYLQQPPLEERVKVTKLMDALQPHCSTDGKPGPEWDAFAKTLPGYLEMWAQVNRIVQECVDASRKPDKDPDKAG